MDTNIFLKVFILFFVISASSALSAQEEFPKPGKMEPNMSEFWLPQPVIVTPGVAKCEEPIPAPSDADVLFDGKDLSKWKGVKTEEAQWIVSDGNFTVKKGTGSIETKKHYRDFQLHLEWKVPASIIGSSQFRGNSGVILQGIYEIQVLDNYINKTYANGQAGSVYKQTAPLVNAMKKPGEWNVYDIIYTAPTYTKDSTYRTFPYVTVIHNGIIVQNNTRINGNTAYIGFPKVKVHGDGPIMLQDHGDPSEAISFRNIWIREL
ncbi:MAG: DUF1080 domain-containing protein [Prolixibacteraceae bacterium]|jgi:hypothetical protein|nr:DUF1080 domain-containing protein [Prolixibacteraceae bacterium]